MSQGVHSLVVWARFQSLEAKMRIAPIPGGRRLGLTVVAILGPLEYPAE